MKLCCGCLNVFKDEVTDCPMGDCGGYDVIDVDDQMVDIVKGFMMTGIEPFTLFSCAGHVWQKYFSGYLMFAINPEYQDIKDLEDFRGYLQELNVNQAVNIDEIETTGYDGYSSFRITTPECGTDRRERLKTQTMFLDFFYHVLECCGPDSDDNGQDSKQGKSEGRHERIGTMPGL